MATLLSSAFLPKINSVDSWSGVWAPLRGSVQWVDGQSAKELAKAWFANSEVPEIPRGFGSLLDSHPLTQALSIKLAAGEVKIPLDTFLGETRNCDLRLEGLSGDDRVLIHVEAKADELFGDRTVAERLAEVATKKRSNIPERIRRLSQLLFGGNFAGISALAQMSSFGALRYQLLHSACAALLDAGSKGIRYAVFVVHELLPLPAHRATPFRNNDGSLRKPLNSGRIKQNENDWKDFLSVLADRVQNVDPLAQASGVLLDLGDFWPPTDLSWKPERGSNPVRLLIGKACDETRQG